ncbi:MAG: hypothetical protein AB7G10_19905 [Reyranellaceae bacterium]
MVDVLVVARGLRTRIAMLPVPDRVPLLAALALAVNLPDQHRRWAALACVARRMARAEDSYPHGALH